LRRAKQLARRVSFLPVTVTVLVFAAYAEALGADTLEITVPDGATFGDVVAAVRALPGGSRLPATPLVARNQHYATLADPVAASDELALIPPVAGG
jgi:molybdopterin converting factor small subunit